MNAPAKRRYWSFPTRAFSDLSAFMLLCWAGFTAATMVLVYSIDRWGSLNGSVWEDAVQIPLWFVLFMGVQVAMVYLPMNITHGMTRRDSATEAGLFVVAFSALTALFLTSGWAIERAVFSLLDVEQSLSNNHIFESARDYPVIFLESWINLAIWTAGGLFIAAAYYRWDGAGLLAIFPALLVASLVDVVAGSSWAPVGRVLDNLFDADSPPLVLVLAVGAAGVAALLLMAWKVIQEMPIRKVSP